MIRALVGLSLAGLIAQSAFARELDGDLDYAVQSVNGAASLTVSSRIPAQTVRVLAVEVLGPTARGRDSERLAVTVPGEQTPAERATIDLGPVATLSRLVAPGRNAADFRDIVAGSDNDCTNCDAIAFAIRVSVELGDGTKRGYLADAYLHYLFK